MNDRDVFVALEVVEVKSQDLRHLMNTHCGNDPRIVRLGTTEPRFAKVLENIHGGTAQKAAPEDSANFMRAVLPVIAGDAPFVLGKMAEQGGFEWIVPPQEPVEKVEEDKDRPPDAPSLRRKPKP